MNEWKGDSVSKALALQVLVSEFNPQHQYKICECGTEMTVLGRQWQWIPGEC